MSNPLADRGPEAIERPDLHVLSIDGITDGKMAPYLDSGDVLAFLLRYRPEYWVANDSVFYRPFLEESILRRAVEAVGGRETGSIEIEGIRFTNLKVRHDEPVPGFAGYRQLFSLSYPDKPRFE